MTSEQGPSPVVVVTGANGLVGARVSDALVRRGATVRAVVRRPGTAPEQEGLEEHVGDFGDAAFAAQVLAGADAVVTTVHPMGSRARHPAPGRRRGHRPPGRGGPRRRRRPARPRLDRRRLRPQPDGTVDVDESSALVGDDADAYGATKRDIDPAIAGSTASPGCSSARRPSSAPATPRSGTRCARPASATTRPSATACRTRPSPGCTSTTSPTCSPTSPPAGSAPRPTSRTARSRAAAPP